MLVKINRLLAPCGDDPNGGQALVEYALILMLVTMISVAVLGAIGQNTLGPLTTIRDAL